jgi:hypothetical protein
LSKEKTSLKHIDNPVLHCGIDSNLNYINKTKSSLENLNLIYKTHLIDSNLVTYLRIFTRLKRYKLNYLFAFTHEMLHPIFKQQLSSKNPSLIVFNFFRLSYFCYINLKK